MPIVCCPHCRWRTPFGQSRAAAQGCRLGAEARGGAQAPLPLPPT